MQGVGIFTVVLALLLCSEGLVKVESQKASALFVFGDSLAEVGNNNFLNSVAKSNYYPYGIDFNRGATGRFSNGKIIVDFIGKFLKKNKNKKEGNFTWVRGS